jgi:peptidyl-prolyl cis-trans isomerase A (cyclophilin A)
MIRRRNLLAAAASVSAAPALLAVAPGVVKVRLSTRLGDILLELRGDKAPVTTANFLRYVDERRMDRAAFYRRSVPPGAEVFDYGVVQGGLQNNPGTATSDFFICAGEQTYLDADPSAKGDNLGFACFGYVIEGMETVHKILAQPVSPHLGVGAMKGEMLSKPLPIMARRA